MFAGWEILHRVASLPFLVVLLACNTPYAVDPAPTTVFEPAPSAESTASPAPSTIQSPFMTASTQGDESVTAPYKPPSPDAVEPPSPPVRVHTQIGTLDDWVHDYAGSGVPETKRPPNLRLATDLGVSSGVVAFSRPSGVYTYDFATKAEAHLRPAFSSRPTFTADGMRIFYVRHSGDFALHVHSMDPKGGDDRDVTGPIRTNGDGVGFALSPDGRRLAYLAVIGGDGTSEHMQIHLVDLRAKKDEIVGPVDQYMQPWFSAESDRLFVVINHWPANGNVASLDLSTRAFHVFPNAGEGEFNAPFSLADRVVFSAGPATGFCCKEEWMFSVNKDGGDIQRFGSFHVFGLAYPRRSPHGRRVAIPWSMREGGFGADYYTEITVAGADGENLRGLTAAFPRPFYSAFEPAWAPDDRYLAFTLAICPYVGCELQMNSIVAVDTDDPAAAPAFLAYGTSPSWAAPPR